MLRFSGENMIPRTPPLLPLEREAASAVAYVGSDGNGRELNVALAAFK